ncbi:MAG: TetR/AcrR family transcriptional regulator [Myxococcota bacterium]
MARRREFDEDEVIDRAMEAFWASGFRATSPQRLLEATGLSRSSLYATFESKEGLFRAALDRYLQSSVRRTRKALAEGTLREGLERMYDGMITHLTTTADYRSCLMCTTALEVPDSERSEEGSRILRDGQRALRGVFEERFSRAKAEGQLRDDADPAELAWFIFNANVGLQVSARLERNPQKLRRVAQRVIDTIC